MNCKPLFLGKTAIGERFGTDDVFVFFGNRHFASNEAKRIFPETQLRFLKQVHGTTVHEIQRLPDTERASNLEKDDVTILEGDGSVSMSPGLGLGLYTADCLPIFLYDSRSGKIAAAHAGWRGLVAGVLHETVRKMNATPDALRVWIGPHIRQQSFEVGADVADRLAKSSIIGDQAITMHSLDPQKRMVNLTLIAVSQLKSHAISEKNLWISSVNTFEDQNYFSYRRDGKTGRLLSFITLLKS